MIDLQQGTGDRPHPVRGHSRWLAVLLGLIPGLGHVYLGRKRFGIVQAAIALSLGLALWFGPVIVAPGNMRLIIWGPLLYCLIILPSCTAFSMVNAWHLASDTPSPDEAGAAISRWGWYLSLAGVAAIAWSLSRETVALSALVRTAPVAVLAIGAWLIGTGIDSRNSRRETVVHAGRFAAIGGFVSVTVIGLAAASGSPVVAAARLWGLIPLAVGVELLIEQERWRHSDHTKPILLAGSAQFVVVVVLIAGIMAIPLQRWTDFPFTSTLALPRVFNLGQPAGLAIRDGRVADRTGMTFASSALPYTGLRYVAHTSGNVQVIGRSDRSDFITNTVMVAVRSRSQAEAQGVLDRFAYTVGRDIDGTTWIVPDELAGLAPGTEVTTDIRIGVPIASDVTVDIPFGRVEVVGVTGNIHVKTGFGQVDIRDCTGMVEVETGWGDVRIDSARCRVVATTGFGNVYCTAASLTEESRLTSKVGGVSCRLTGDVNVDLVAKTNQGAIRTAVSGSTTRRFGEQTLRATLGTGGPSLAVESGFGDVSVDLGGK